MATGALDDWADRDRDAAAGRPKPIPQRLVAPGAAMALAGGGVALQLGASLLVGTSFTLLGLVALGGAVAYDLCCHARRPAWCRTS